MTELVWGTVGNRRFETGLDRGVLYETVTSIRVGIPWDGLVSVADSVDRESKPYYLDGVKYLDHEVVGDYSAKLQAYTYPPEFEKFQGVDTVVTKGVFLHDQPSRTFCLSYRTKIGNDIEGEDYGYRIHVVYDLRAIPQELSHNTDSDSPSPLLLTWNLTATPQSIINGRPTAHLSFDTTEMESDVLEILETTLYGSEDSNAVLPSMPDLLELLAPVDE